MPITALCDSVTVSDFNPEKRGLNDLAHGEEVRQPPLQGGWHAPLPKDVTQLILLKLHTALLPGRLPLLHKLRVVSQVSLV
jgi:hypothetical protein